jgi:excisionase family DNA binding protein
VLVLTVMDAARRTGKDPETIRRWIRGGRLRSTRSGRQHLIDEDELLAIVAEPRSLPLPGSWRTLPSGQAAPDWVEALHESRSTR